MLDATVQSLLPASKREPDVEPCLFEEPQFVIYKIINRRTGAAYIGLTSQGAEERFNGHWHASKRQISALYRAMRKYGKKAFFVQILAIGKTADDLPSLEIKLIAEHRTFVSDGGYNMTRGGEGSPGICDEVRRNMSVAAKHRMANPAIRQQISKKLTGRKLDPEHAAASARGHLGKQLSASHRASLSASKIGRIPTPEHRAKIAATLRGRKPPPQAIAAAVLVNTGKVCSDATRAKISATKRARGPGRQVQASHSPEASAKRSASLRKSWAARKLAAQNQDTSGCDDSFTRPS
jgi:group I intron endonuclease